MVVVREVEVLHLWNQLWGMARYDIWIRRWDGPTVTTWRVEAEKGGKDSGRFWASKNLPDEGAARAIVERIMARRSGYTWVDITRTR